MNDKQCVFCEETKRHKHKCSYMKIGLTKAICEDYSGMIKIRDERILELCRKINQMEAELLCFKNCLNNSQQHLKPILEDFKPKAFSDIINSSYWNCKVKESTLRLFNSYEEYCIKNEKKLYDIDNAFIYLKDIKKFKSGTFRHRLRMFCKIFKKALNNPFIQPTFMAGSNEPPKIKHFITTHEIHCLLRYLKAKNNATLLIIVEILYKFGVRIGSITKLKVINYDRIQKIITFEEKNKAVIKRKLGEGLSRRIETMIKVFKLNNNQYLIFPHIYPKDEYKRRIYFTNLIISTIKRSNAFQVNSLECFSAHMFRATLATRVSLLHGSEIARKELNHKSQNTTMNIYVRPEDRGLYENIDEELNRSEKLLKKKRIRFANNKIQEGENKDKKAEIIYNQSLKINRGISKKEDTHQNEDSDDSAFLDSNYYDEDDNLSVFENNIDDELNLEKEEQDKLSQPYDVEEAILLNKNFPNKNDKMIKPFEIFESNTTKITKNNKFKKKFTLNKIKTDNRSSNNYEVCEEIISKKPNFRKREINNQELMQCEEMISRKKQIKEKYNINRTLQLILNMQFNKEKDENNKTSFFNILHSTGRKFTDDILVFNNKMYSSTNESKLKLQELKGNNEIIYNRYKNLTIQGYYPNLEVKKICNKKGFGVVTNCNIRKGTLLCEYAGILDYNKNIGDTKDIFNLLKTKKSDYDRCINPNEYCNLARFINCANNLKEKNCETIRILINGKAKVLIYAWKDIKSNQEILYEYDNLKNGEYYF